MRDIIIIAKNVLKLTLRKKSSILVFMLLPIMSIFISKFLNTTQSQVVNIGICDQDKTTLSEDFKGYLEAKDKLKVIYVDEEKINSEISNERLDSVVVLEKGFEDKIINGDLEKVDMVSVKGAEILVWQENYINYYISNLVNIGKSSEGNKDTFFKVYDDFKARESSIKNEKVDDLTKSFGVTKQSIALLLVFMLTGATISAGTIAKDKANRVFNRLMTSPLKISRYILGNSIANFVLNLLQIIVILVASKILKLDFHVPLVAMFIILGTFSLVSVGLGMFIASISSTSAQVSQIANVIIVPTCMLSGCFWQLELMPKIMQKIALVLPQTWVIRAIDSLQSGNTFKEILLNIVIILAFAMGLFLLSVFNLKKDQSIKSYV